MKGSVSIFRGEMRWYVVLLIMIAIVLLLLLRVTGLGVFITIDEPTWATRSQNFHDALLEGDLFPTYQSEHPGVVTMWIGTLAIRVSRAAEGFSPRLRVLRMLWNTVSARSDGVPAVTFWARWGVALVTWGGILALYFPLRHLFGRAVAVLGVLLVGIDPFYLAHSRLHHLDALLTTFVMLSAASLLAYRKGESHKGRYLILSGISGGLAMANKSPAALLLPWPSFCLWRPGWRTVGGACSVWRGVSRMCSSGVWWRPVRCSFCGPPCGYVLWPWCKR